MAQMKLRLKNFGELINEDTNNHPFSGDVWRYARITDMSEDQFVKLFKYVEAFRADVDKRFIEAARDHADIRGAIAELSAQVRDYHHEMVILSHQIDKMRDAIKQIARETGVKLSVEL